MRIWFHHISRYLHHSHIIFWPIFSVLKEFYWLSIHWLMVHSMPKMKTLNNTFLFVALFRLFSFRYSANQCCCCSWNKGISAESDWNFAGLHSHAKWSKRARSRIPSSGRNVEIARLGLARNRIAAATIVEGLCNNTQISSANWWVDFSDFLEIYSMKIPLNKSNQSLFNSIKSPLCALPQIFAFLFECFHHNTFNRV